MLGIKLESAYKIRLKQLHNSFLSGFLNQRQSENQNNALTKHVIPRGHQKVLKGIFTASTKMPTFWPVKLFHTALVRQAAVETSLAPAHDGKS